MGHGDFSVASAHALRGSLLLRQTEEDEVHRHLNAMGNVNNNLQARRNSEKRKSVRFTPSTKFADSSKLEESIDTNIFTQSEHGSHGSISSFDFAASVPQVKVAREASVQLLTPAVYAPPQDGANLVLPATTYSASPVNVKRRVEEIEALPDHIANTQLELHIDTEETSHKRSPSSSSTSSGRLRERGDIYFTPVDVTRSQIFLSSPVGSPTTDPDSPTLPQYNDEDDQCPTPKASKAPLQRQSFALKSPRRRVKNDAIKVTPEQLDKLVVALAESRMLQKRVQGGGWDIDDVPDDASIISSFSQVSLPTLTSASTLYSQQNDNFVTERSENRNKQPTTDEELVLKHLSSLNARKTFGPFGGGVALCDSKVHGAPIRYVSNDYKFNGGVLRFGSSTYLSVPYGADVESSLRIETPPHHVPGKRVVIQCKTQVVDRKSGKQVYALMGEEDVTEHFVKAAIAELAKDAKKSPGDIIVSRPSPVSSPEVDFLDLLDDLLIGEDTEISIENAITSFKQLDASIATMQTLILMSELDRVNKNHRDFLILRPTTFHENGRPSNMRVPWVSQQLHTDWYAKDGPGYTQAAKDFQECIVANVAKHATATRPFTFAAYWKDVKEYIRCVPLSAEGHCDAWACFVHGEFAIDL